MFACWCLHGQADAARAIGGQVGRHDFVLTGPGLSETKRTERANAKLPTYGENST